MSFRAHAPRARSFSLLPPSVLRRDESLAENRGKEPANVGIAAPRKFAVMGAAPQ
jgi:hypothetical protein